MQIWEQFIKDQLKVGFWNEYISKDKIVFLFKLENDFRRYEVIDFENDEVLLLCRKLFDPNINSIEEMITSNDFYCDKIFKQDM
ncbi:MAG TPA: hypothetical protein PLE82_04565 [Saccharofermentans sp.]|nr:hypothetical protein [Saccharofermentans sp.]HPG64595.1 hypothetical protein [Saccharofermentans sp.]HPJ81149.1 hypothetical protein [Saccharofermentans sp.]HPM75330.1 hypothetical protein [Saccharofermentans sp.]